MLPTRSEAERLLMEGVSMNPGPWEGHSKTAAHCAEAIARRCEGMDPDKAYILGLLHDIGRRYGRSHLRHVYDGYRFLMSLGYDEAARGCLTHSFHTGRLDDYIGNTDTTEEETRFIQNTLSQIDMNDYDRLIQLCDAISGGEGVMDMEERMRDVERRYGHYPEEKREKNRVLRRYFEGLMGMDLYRAVDRDGWKPQTDTIQKEGKKMDAERFAWKGRIKPGMQEEYKRRHDEIWPEMLALLKSAGIRNYTIWSDGRDVFGYYECEKGIAFAEHTQAQSPIVDKWNDYMQDVLDLEMDPETGAQPKLKMMFKME